MAYLLGSASARLRKEESLMFCLSCSFDGWDMYRDVHGTEMCVGMGKAGIQWVPWDFRGNGNNISHGMKMEMGIECMGMNIKTWKWEKHYIQHGVRTVLWVMQQPDTVSFFL